MGREKIRGFFNLRTEVFTDYTIFEKPINVFNIDETGFQINNESGSVLASRGARDVHTVSSSERGRMLLL